MARFTAWKAFQPISANFETAFDPFLPLPLPSPRLKLSLNIIKVYFDGPNQLKYYQIYRIKTKNPYVLSQADLRQSPPYHKAVCDAQTAWRVKVTAFPSRFAIIY